MQEVHGLLWGDVGGRGDCGSARHAKWIQSNTCRLYAFRVENHDQMPTWRLIMIKQENDHD